MFNPHPLTPNQLREYCTAHLDLLLDQVRSDPRNDPAPQLLVLYMPPKTATSAAEFRNPKNWQRDLITFPDFGDNRRELLARGPFGRGARDGYDGVSVVAICLSSIVWIAPVNVPPGKSLKTMISTATLPSKHPQRSEAVVCWAQTITDQKHCITYPIGRAADGAAVLGQPRSRQQQQAVLLDLFFQHYAQAFLTYAG